MKYIFVKPRYLLYIPLAMACTMAACNAPAYRSQEDLFFVEPEILETVQPHLYSWSRLSPEESEAERAEIGQKLGRTIEAHTWNDPLTGEEITVIVIPIEHWHEWERGMIYIPVDEEMGSFGGKKLLRIREYIYAYNVTY